MTLLAAEGVNPRTLLWWSSRLGRKEDETPAFIELAVPVESGRIEIVVRDGVLIQVSGAFDPEALRRVAAALQTR